MANLIESHSVAPMEQSASGKAWKLKIIEGNKQGSSAYYPASVLEAQADIVKPNTRIYLDHPSLDEAENRPERSARDIIGYFRTGSSYEDGNLVAEAEFFSEWQTWVKERAEAGVIGMSIRGNGIVEESADGTPTLTRFDHIRSVDLVTEPGAGGGFEEILESQRATAQEVEESNMEFPANLAEALDAQAKDVKTMTEKTGALITAVEALVESLKPEPKKEATATEVAEALVEAKLTKSSRARVMAAVDAGTELAEAIKAEQDLQKEILEEAEKASELEGNLQESKKSDELTNGFIS